MAKKCRVFHQRVKKNFLSCRLLLHLSFSLCLRLAIMLNFALLYILPNTATLSLSLKAHSKGNKQLCGAVCALAIASEEFVIWELPWPCENTLSTYVTATAKIAFLESVAVAYIKRYKHTSVTKRRKNDTLMCLADNFLAIKRSQHRTIAMPGV